MSLYNQLVDDFFEGYRREYGERKLRKVTEKILHSKKIKNLLDDLAFKGPHKEEIVYPVMSIPFFTIAR